MLKGANVIHPVKEIYTYKTNEENVEVIQIPALWDNYSYIYREGDIAVVIDPSSYSSISDVIIERKLSVKYILITHDHIDHIYDLDKIYNEYKAPVFAAKGSEIPFKYEIIEDNQVLRLNKSSLTAMFLSGHYAETYSDSSIHRNIAWYSKNAGVIFSGDVLFSFGYGFIKKGSEEILLKSLKKMRSLPPETNLFFGHEYTFYNMNFVKYIDAENEYLKKRIAAINELHKNNRPTVPIILKTEKNINPFLRWDDIEFKNKLKLNETDDVGFIKSIMNFKCKDIKIIRNI